MRVRTREIFTLIVVGLLMFPCCLCSGLWYNRHQVQIINRTSLTSQMLCVQKRPLWWTSPAAPLSKASTAQLLQQQRHNPSAHNRTHKTIVINILLSVSVSVAEFPLMIYNPTFNHIYFKWNCTEHRPAVIQPDVISSSLCENSPEEWRSHDRPLSGSSCVVLMQLY